MNQPPVCGEKGRRERQWMMWRENLREGDTVLAKQQCKGKRKYWVCCSNSMAVGIEVQNQNGKKGGNGHKQIHYIDQQ